jgi:hypothetical protein
MATVEHGELQVVVPVGFLLAEAQEVTVSVSRPGGEPLPVRLRLIPARPAEEAEDAPQEGWEPREEFDDFYGEPEYGGGD